MANSFYEDETPPPRECDHETCHEAGIHPAPKSKNNLSDKYYFCLDHVREYNKKWNYFADFSEAQIYAQMRRDMVGDRPTWPASIPLKMEKRLHDFIRRFTRDSGTSHKPRMSVSKEAQALETLGLGPQADQKQIKSRYRELVKKYHPDKNPDNPKAAERFKIVAEAYMILQNAWHGKNTESP